MNIKLFQLAEYWWSIKHRALDVIDEVCSTGQAQNGYIVRGLEKLLTEFGQRKHAVTLASCTDAIACAIRAFDLPPDSFVAMSSLTFIGVANSVRNSNMIPYFVDCDEYGHIDLEKVPKECRALIVTDLWGCPMDYDKLDRWRSVNPDVKVIMDAAQSIESYYSIRSSLSIGDIAVTSFSPSKTVTCFGSGGALLTDNTDYYNFAVKWRTHGKKTNSDLAEMSGTNSMMSSMEAAVVWVALEKSGANHRYRSQLIDAYLDSLKHSRLKALPYRGRHTWHKFIIDAGDERDAAMTTFAVNGIETRVFYSPLIHQETIYKDFPRTDMSVSERFVQNTFAIPCQHTLKPDEIDYICKVIETFK